MSESSRISSGASPNQISRTSLTLNSNAEPQKNSRGYFPNLGILDFFFGSNKTSAQATSTQTTQETSSSSAPKVRSYCFFSPATTVRIGGKDILKSDKWSINNEARNLLLQTKEEAKDSDILQRDCDELLKTAVEKSNKEPNLKETYSEATANNFHTTREDMATKAIEQKWSEIKDCGVPKEDVEWAMEHNPMFLAEVRNKEKFTQLNQYINEISAPYGDKVRRQLQYIYTQNFPALIKNDITISKLSCFKKNYFVRGDYDFPFDLSNKSINSKLLIKVTAKLKQPSSELLYNSGNSEVKKNLLESESKTFDGSFTFSCEAILTKEGIRSLKFNRADGGRNLVTPKSSWWWPFNS